MREEKLDRKIKTRGGTINGKLEETVRWDEAASFRTRTRFLKARRRRPGKLRSKGRCRG